MRNRLAATTSGSPVPSRSDLLAPTFTVITGSGPDTAEGRRAHPAAGAGRVRGLSLNALEWIAIGLAQSSPAADHQWTEGTRRRYTCLLDTDLYDAWLINWSPSASLELHDHGGSQGAVAVASGRLVETYTDLRLRHPVRSRSINQEDAITVPATRIHEMSNPGPDDALSVHVYSPPLKSMTFFDPRPGNFLTALSTSTGDLAALEESDLILR